MSLKKLIPIRSSESAPLRTKYGLLEWTILEPNTRSCLRKKSTLQRSRYRKEVDL